MWRKISWLLVLALFCMFMPSLAHAAEGLVHPISLYQEAVKVETMIKHGEQAAKVLESLDQLSMMYTRVDLRNLSQRIEGVQAVSAELIGLKQMFAAVKGADQAVAEFRIHRIVIAFDSLAYPNSPAWLPVARSMETHVEKVIDAVAKQDQKLARTYFGKLRSERDQISLALQLHGNPAELNAQQSAHRFVEGQLQAEQVAEKQGTLDALGSYKNSLGNMTASIQVVQEPPLLPVITLTLDPLMYGTVTAGLFVFGGWRWVRKKKN